MADEKKYAVLDTDFVPKTHIIKNTREEHLIDRVLAFDGYEFYCHEMMADELSRHGYRESQEWLASVGAGVACICVLSVFYKMRKIGVVKEEAAEFYDSYMEGCKRVNMTRIGIYEWNGTYRKVKTDMQTVFDNIYADVYRIGRDGNIYQI